MIQSVNTSALVAAQDRFAVSATNISRLGIEGATALKAHQTEGPAVVVSLSDEAISLTKELTDQMSASHQFKANAKTIQAQDEMFGTLIDIIA